MTDEGKRPRPAIMLTPEPPSTLRRAVAVLLLLIGVPLLLGSGLCTFYFAELQFGGPFLVVSGLMVWGGRRLLRR